MPLIKVVYVLPDYITFYYKGYFEPFIASSGDYFHPFWKYFLVIKFSFHLLLIILWLGIAVLFINKNQSFPKCFTFVVTLNTMLFLISSYVSSKLTNNENIYYFYPILEIESYEWYPTLILVVFLAPYILLSIRAKAIFSNSFSEKTDDKSNISNLDSSNVEMSHPVFEAISNRKLPQTMYYIQELKDYQICDSQGRSLVHAAVESQMPGVLRILLESEIDINAKDKNGDTPLHIAICTNNPDPVLIKMLIRSGADLNEKNRFDETVLDQLKRVESAVNKEILRYIELNNLYSM